jgi:16S rRNA (uracil1498-N3)-methyltransferase
MKQFLLSSTPARCGGESGAEGAGRVVRLSGKDYHYLVRVRRLRPGAVFNAVEPGGAGVRVLVRSVEGGVLLGECLDTGKPLPQSDTAAPLSHEGNAALLPPLVLFQALPKGAKMDMIVRQAVEGGIAAVVPFTSARSAPKLKKNPDSGGSGRVERWRRIVREARQQSGSAIATTVEAPRAFEEALAFWGELRERHKRPVGLLLHPPAKIGRNLGKTAAAPLENASFHGYLEGNPGFVAIAVGPEGGFSPEEAVRFVEEGFNPVSMGNSVLRTETAALYAAAAIRIILLESESWIYRTPRSLIL